MDREELARRYFDAWNQKNVSELLKIMHPQASYYDAFWGESCTGEGLSKYFGVCFAEDVYWYRPDDKIIPTQNGLIIRYVAFDRNDPEGLEPVLNGADVITISGELIMTISDYYCDPNPVNLTEVAMLAEKQHGRLNIGSLGLGAQTSGRIKRRLAELAAGMTVFLNPGLTVTQLSDHVGCSVMHLFHVLEEEKETTFLDFVNECRARHASTLLLDKSNGDIRFDRIAEQSGFKTITDFRNAFQSTFDISPDDYLQKFSQ